MIKGRQLFLMVGPSGSGKNTLVTRIIGSLTNIVQMPTATTRTIRSYELNGKEHFFYTEEKFKKLIQKNEFAEWQVVHGNFYGSMKSILESGFSSSIDYIADIEVLGALTLKELYPDNVVLVFVRPTSLDDLEKRIQNRGGVSEDEIAIRLNRVNLEMAYQDKCDYLVINDDLQVAVEQLKGIIIAERSRRDIVNLRTNPGHDHIVYHLTATGIVFNKDYNKIILVKRKKGERRGWWYPPGGHVEIGEYPHQAVTREVKEETGYDVEILSQHHSTDIAFEDARVVPQPYWILEERLENHFHYDFIYICKIKTILSNIIPDSDTEWFFADDIQKIQTLPDIKLVVNELNRREIIE